MKTTCILAAALALGACVYDIDDTRPRSIDHSTAQTDALGRPCPSGAGVYVPKKRNETPYDKTVRDSARPAGQSALGCDRPRSNI